MTLAPIDASNAVAVSDYLSKARDWLATAVEMTGPEQIAAAKAEIATAAEATKQLGLSKEIQLDAQEMVRRAEYALGKAIRKGQAEGTVSPHGGINGHNKELAGSATSLPKPLDFGSRSEIYGSQSKHGSSPGALALADDIDSEDFDAAIDAAKAEGNLSRANVARKAREVAAEVPSRRMPRPAAEKTLNTIAYHLEKAAREAKSLTSDQTRRLKPKADLWTVGLRESVEVLQDLLTSLTQE